MTCVMCNAGTPEEGRTTFTSTKDVTVVIRGDPGLVCSACGQAYLDIPTTDRLLEPANAMRTGAGDAAAAEYGT